MLVLGTSSSPTFEADLEAYLIDLTELESMGVTAILTAPSVAGLTWNSDLILAAGESFAVVQPRYEFAVLMAINLNAYQIVEIYNATGIDDAIAQVNIVFAPYGINFTDQDDIDRAEDIIKARRDSSIFPYRPDQTFYRSAVAAFAQSLNPEIINIDTTPTVIDGFVITSWLQFSTINTTDVTP
jgi:hypothetical protein